MTTEQLLTWLDGKMADHAGGKVVPPHATIAAQLAAEARAKLAATSTERVLAGANIPGQVDVAFAALGSHLATLEKRDLPAMVASGLASDLTQSWRTPVAQLASDVCRLSPIA